MQDVTGCFNPSYVGVMPSGVTAKLCLSRLFVMANLRFVTVMYPDALSTGKNCLGILEKLGYTSATQDK